MFLRFCYLAFLTITSGGREVRSQVYSGTAMGTAIKKTIYSEDITLSSDVDKMIDDTLKKFEEQTSVRIEGSEVSKLNTNYAVGGTNKVSDDLLDILSTELQIWEETKGAFSPCLFLLCKELYALMQYAFPPRCRRDFFLIKPYDI